MHFEMQMQPPEIHYQCLHNSNVQACVMTHEASGAVNFRIQFERGIKKDEEESHPRLQHFNSAHLIEPISGLHVIL